MKRVKTPTLIQMESVECGAVALGIILHYYGKYVSLEELRLTCGVSRNGSTAGRLTRAARHYGLDAKGYRKEPASLRELTSPFIVFWNFNHFVVVEGFDQGQVYLNDPAVGPRTVSDEEFDLAFTGVVLMMTPSPEFQRGGQKLNVIEALRQRARGYEKIILYLVMLNVMLIILGLGTAQLTRVFLDVILPKRDAALLSTLLIALFSLSLVTTLGIWLQQSALLRANLKLSLRLTSNFLWHILQLPVTFFQQRYSGELAQRILLNQNLAGLITGELGIQVVNVGLVFIYMGILLVYDVWMTGLVIVALFANIGLLIYFAQRRRDLKYQLLQEDGKLTGIMTAGLQVIESLKAAGAENTFFARLTGQHTKVLHASQSLMLLTLRFSTVITLVGTLLNLFIFAIGSSRVMDGSFTLGLLVIFQNLTLSLLSPINRLIGLGEQLQEIEGEVYRLEDVLNHPIEKSFTGADQLQGAVELKGISFTYGGMETKLLSDISLSVQPGQHIAIAGNSGSGKSTLLKIIASLYPATEGEVLFDGCTLQRNGSLAIIDQDIILFEGTIRENLTLWNDQIPEELIEQAAKDACIYADIMQAGGYVSPVLEGGKNFSGGQRQRLEIARALVTNPSVLLFDEATSALDTITEAQVYDNLRKRGCTCIIVAHRLSTIRHCDEIIVLDKGRIIERGTHDELINLQGKYRQLVEETQFGVAADSVQQREQPLPIPGLLDVCRIIGNFQGIIFQEPKPDASLDEIAAASNVRVRPVILKDHWWQRDGQPILAVRKNDRRPVALLPHAHQSYTLHDAASEQITHVDKSTSTQLEPFGYVFYRTFPNENLNVNQLFRFSLLDNWGDMLMLIFLGLLSSGLQLATPILSAFIIDRVIPYGDRGTLWGITIALALVSMVVTLLSIAQSIALIRFQQRMESATQAALWDRLLKLPLAFFRQYSVGDLGMRSLSIAVISRTLMRIGLSSVLTVTLLIANLLFLLVLDSNLALLVIGITSCAALIALWAGWIQLQYQRELLMNQGKIAGHLVQLVGGVSKLRAAGGERRGFKSWAQQIIPWVNLTYQAGKVQNYFAAFGNFYSTLTWMGVFVVISRDFSISPGLFVAFSIAFRQLLEATMQSINLALSAVELLPHYERSLPLLQTPLEVTDKRLIPLSGAIEIRNLSFAYHATPVLCDISLHIRPGEFVAIVGPSGSGKSTLIRLMCGFEYPTEGEIYYDAFPLSQFNAHALRQQLGVVLQNSQLIAGATLLDNIGAATAEDAWRAARLAGIDKDIEQMPMRMQTLVGENGAHFSVGQRQRLLLARALVRSPKVLLLDEATSALDNITQSFVIKNLETLNITRIVVAHRLSTIVNADRIIVMDEGRIVQSGTFEELSSQEGLFARLKQSVSFI